MPIRFRCRQCGQSLSISRRKAGATVDCPTCGSAVLVPLEPESVARGRQAEGRPEIGAEAADRAGAESFGAERTKGVGFRRLRLDPDELDMTPMVDVTFQLMIFFMLTASYAVQKAIATPRTDPSQQGARQALRTLAELEQNHVMVRIGADNTIWVDETLTEPRQLANRLRASVRATGRTEILISADDRAWHEAVIQAIDAANAVGIERIRLATPAGSRTLEARPPTARPAGTAERE